MCDKFAFQWSPQEHMAAGVTIIMLGVYLRLLSEFNLCFFFQLGGGWMRGWWMI